MSEMNDSEIKEYLEEWRIISEPLEKLTGIQRMAFDPSVQFIYERKTVTLPRWLLELINTGLAAREAALEQTLEREKRLQFALIEAGLEIEEPWNNNASKDN